MAKDKKASKQADPWEGLCKALRKSNGVDTRDAVMQGVRWDFFRGKDLAAWLKAHPTVMDALPLERFGFKPGNASYGTVDYQIDCVARGLMYSQLIFRAERQQKIPKKGHKLLKFPKRLEPHPHPMSWDAAEGFYVWRFSPPASMWTYVGSAGVVVVTLGCCMFPLSPPWVKLGVLYLCIVLLAVLLSVSLVRAAVYALVWVLFGKNFWLIPNLFSEEVGMTEALTPWYAFLDDSNTPSLGSRLIGAALTTSVIYCLYTYSPETEEMAQTFQVAHKGILEMLDLYEIPKQLGDGGHNSTNVTNAANATNVTNTSPEDATIANATSANLGAGVEGMAPRPPNRNAGKTWDGVTPPPSTNPEQDIDFHDKQEL